MGYISVIVVAIIVIPLLFLLLGKRPTAAGPQRDNGVTRAEPASDQPSPGAGTVNQVAPGKERRLPPG
jgi:hypothetical protein